MLAHLRGFAPELHRVAGEAGFSRLIDVGLTKAASYGFEQRGSIRLILEIMCMFGQDFDADPQYRRLWPHGDPAAAPMVFADRLHGNVCDYLERCVGGARQILLSAIDAMLSTPIAPVGDLDAYLRHLLESVYPQKYAYLAEDDLRDLIALCHGLSAHVAIMSPTGRTLVVLLAVCFGCGFIEDPLYPWISARLRGDGPEHRRIDKTLSVLRIYATTAAKNLRKAS